MTAKAIYNFLNTIAPFSTAAEWDNCGLSVGSLDADIKKVVVALDVTTEVIDFAMQERAGLVLTHHPLIFQPLKNIEDKSVLYNAVCSGLTFISSHTCLDMAYGGVNDCLAEEIGLRNIEPTGTEFLNIGEINECTPEGFAVLLKEKLGGTVRYNNFGRPVRAVAFCAGSGGELIKAAALYGADALLTGEAKYNEFLEAAEYGITLFAAGHYETEIPVCNYLKKCLENYFMDELEVVIFNGKPPINTL